MDRVVLSVATTGSWPTRRQTPYVPITPEEIAAQAVAAWREGAAIVHIHVRDAQERVTVDLALYRRVVEMIRAQGCDVLVNLSTSGGAGAAGEEARLAIVDLRPDLASFDAGTMNFGERVFANPPQFLEQLALKMQQVGVKPEIECFDTSFIYNALRLVEKGLLQAPLWFQFVLGVRGGAPAGARQLVHMVEQIPPGAPWSVCAVGRDQLPMNVQAIAMGGHARTGLEDNIYYRRGELATSNAQLVARLVRIARECGREPATPAEAREILGLVPQAA